MHVPWPGKKTSKMRSCHVHNILYYILFCRSSKRVSWWIHIISIMQVGVILFWGSYRLNTSRFIRYILFLYYILYIYVKAYFRNGELKNSPQKPNSVSAKIGYIPKPNQCIFSYYHYTELPDQ